MAEISHREMICRSCGHGWTKEVDTSLYLAELRAPRDCPICGAMDSEEAGSPEPMQPLYTNKIQPKIHHDMVCSAKRCGHRWRSSTERIPVRCPKCRSVDVREPWAENRALLDERIEKETSQRGQLTALKTPGEPSSSPSSSPSTEIDKPRPRGRADQYCTSCGNKRSSEDVFCGRCGVRLKELTVQDTQQVERSSSDTSNQTISAPQPDGKSYSNKSRVTAGILGILLGGAGVHRFYLGSPGIAILQLIATIITFGLASLWGLIEGIILLAGGNFSDGNGNLLRK